MPFIRTGDCNRCGQCCGADGSPRQHNPWPSNWPDAWGSKSASRVIEMWPHAQFLMSGLETNARETVKLKANGTIKITGQGAGNYHYVWVEGQGFCKDISAKHDGSGYSLECPFLAPDPGDGSRPCALVGSREESKFTSLCQDGDIRKGIENRTGLPPLVLDTQEQVDTWFARHPDCSFTYEAQ